MSCGNKCNCPTYRDHLRSINFSAAAMPTRSRSMAAVEADRLEKQWDKDMPAYKRMRDENLHPTHIDGSAEMEAKATDPLEVNTGHLYGDKLSMVKDVQQVVQSTGDAS